MEVHGLSWMASVVFGWTFIGTPGHMSSYTRTGLPGRPSYDSGSTSSSMQLHVSPCELGIVLGSTRPPPVHTVFYGSSQIS